MNVKKNDSKMLLRTQEINELLGQSPNYLITWGTTWFIIIVISFFVAAAFIDYPETLSGTVSIKLSKNTNLDSPCFAIAEFPILSSGKLAKDQQVVIKLKNYSSQEYGVILGKIVSIGPSPINEKYKVYVKIPRLCTTNNFKIPGNILNIDGYIYVIIKDKTLLHHFFW